jgi:ElaB/YqjD/DUF883 family membrane-anchored ribosome-binding protein
MPNFNEELEKILSQVLMEHHDDISSQDDDAIAEARDAITELVKEIVPEEKPIWRDATDYAIENPVKAVIEDREAVGHNSCRTEMLRRVE